MKLYDSNRAPNPRRVRIFLAEKGVQVPTEQVDLVALQQKSPEFSALNPVQRVPALVLDDGTVITESIAICRYIEMVHPQPLLFGADALDQVMVEMWQRRVEFHLLTPVSHVVRHLHPGLKEMEVPQVPAWGEANKPRVMEFLAVLDATLAQRPFIAGERYTVADITTLVSIDFLRPARLAIPEELTNLRRWHAEVSARPSAAA